MIKKLQQEEMGQGYYCSGAGRPEIIAKINEIVDVVNALIDGEFPNSMERRDFLLKLARNLRKAQREVKD